MSTFESTWSKAVRKALSVAEMDQKRNKTTIKVLNDILKEKKQEAQCSPQECSTVRLWYLRAIELEQ